jgi:hypothetical protein
MEWRGTERGGGGRGGEEGGGEGRRGKRKEGRGDGRRREWRGEDWKRRKMEGKGKGRGKRRRGGRGLYLRASAAGAAGYTGLLTETVHTGMHSYNTAQHEPFRPQTTPNSLTKTLVLCLKLMEEQRSCG